MIKGGMSATRVSNVGVVVDALVYVCKLLPLSCGYVQRYEGGAWLTSRRAVGDFSLRRAFATARARHVAGKRKCQESRPKFTYESLCAKVCIRRVKQSTLDVDIYLQPLCERGEKAMFHLSILQNAAIYRAARNMRREC